MGRRGNGELFFDGYMVSIVQKLINFRDLLYNTVLIVTNTVLEL